MKNRVPSKFSELENYNFNSNKSVKTAKKNLVELIKERESLRFKYYNQPENFRQIEADAVNKLIKQQLNYLDSLNDNVLNQEEISNILFKRQLELF